jgi:WD40 repeat protein
LHTLADHTKGVRRVDISNDGQRAVSVGWDGKPRVWDLASGTLLRVYWGHRGVYGVAFLPDNQRVLTAASNQIIKIWDSVSGATLLRIPKWFPIALECGYPTAFAMTPDGHYALTACKSSFIEVWDLVRAKRKRYLWGHHMSVLYIAVTPDGTRAVSAAKDGVLRVWNLANGKSLTTLTGHDDWFMAMAVSPDGQYVAVGGQTGVLTVWHTDQSQPIAVFQTPPTSRGHPRIGCCTFAADSRTLVAGDWAGRVYILRLAGV